jgi:protein O-GlcNAc transferase
MSSDSPSQHDLQTLIALFNQGRLQEAIERASALAQLYPNVAMLHDVHGVALAQTQAYAPAIACFDASLRLRPTADAYNNRGIALQNLQRLSDALADFDKAIELRPDFAIAHFNRGLVLQDLARPHDALASYDQAIALQTDYAEAHDNRGGVLQDLKRFDEALRSHDKALALAPDYAVAHYNRGNALRELERFPEALSSYDAVLRIDPRHAEALNNRANTLWRLRRLREARADYDRAIALKPTYADAFHNRGNLLQDLNRLDDAVADYDRALRLQPDYAEAHNNRGSALQLLNRFDEAIANFDTALRLRPDFIEATYNRVAVAARMCDWRTPASAITLDGATSPFASLTAFDDPARQLQWARAWTRAKCPPPAARLPAPQARPPKLRVGYFSADFHDHAVMVLMARMLELHDRDKFEIHAFSYGAARDDAMRRRIITAVDQFHDISEVDDAGVAAHARQHGIDIAIDLNGHTSDARLGIFAHRAAPIQINYLGYPGSTGAEFIDYIIADNVVAPPASRAFFSEKVITLPHSYQPNDDQRAVADKAFARAELGLPADGFVFCCFNNSFKISPAEFDIWMRVLRAIDGSVLWLLKDNAWAETNLRAEARARDVDPQRLVFAERMPLPLHLARQRCADLFLDTFNYNAHTTASDALWAGLPILTKQGKSFAARVAASLLHATGMPELITETAENYERLALELATNPARLAALRTQLAANRATAPLFNSAQYTRDIERAYEAAFQRLIEGRPADHIELN